MVEWVKIWVYGLGVYGRKWREWLMGLRFSAISECFESVWRIFGEKMREIREFKAEICDFPDIDHEQLVF
jgi:hypothetical protein